MSGWQKFLFPLALPFSLFYSLLQCLRAFAYQRQIFSSHRLPGKVISIGNIELGGTGKSPLVIEVCRYLESIGARPAVLTRGYRSGLHPKDSLVLLGAELVLPPENSPTVNPDEARMQAVRLATVPIIVGSLRFRAAQRFLSKFPAPTHWILDDGFQHLSIKRDLDLVLLDARRPFDTGWCLPAGRLREPFSALRRADAVIFTRADADFPAASALQLIKRWDLPSFRARFADGSPVLMVGKEPSHPSHQPKRWLLALGLARPERLERSLEAQGFSIIRRHLVGDHERFDFNLLKAAATEADGLLTSEKDYWRAPEAFADLGIPIYTLPLHVDWIEPGSLPKIFNLLTSV